MPGFTDSERLTIYSQLRSYESDFDKAQSQMRTIASAWSAAMLAAIALITINSVTPIVVPSGAKIIPDAVFEGRAETFLYLRQVICLVASVGLFAFWFVDQRVYQRLLHSVFAYGLHIELKNPDLPQIRTAAFASNLDITRWLGWFYRVQLWAFWLLSCFFLLTAKVSGGAAIAIPFLHFLFAMTGELIAQSWPSLKEIVDRLYKDLSGAWPDLKNPNAAATAAWVARVTTNPAPAKPPGP